MPLWVNSGKIQMNKCFSGLLKPVICGIAPELWAGAD
jgi:hypothetical protein